MAEHVGDENVIEPVSIQVRHVEAHGKMAALAKAQARRGAEPALSLVKPDAVRRIKIIADPDIRQAVLVQIPDQHTEPPIKRRQGQRMTVFVQESATVERDDREAGAAVVVIKDIRFAVFFDAAPGIQTIAMNQIPIRDRSAIHL